MGGQKRPLEENEHENIRKLKKQRISESSSSETDTTPTRDQIAKGKKNNLAPFHQLNYQSSPPNSNRNRNNKKFPTYNKNHNNPKQPKKLNTSSIGNENLQKSSMNTNQHNKKNNKQSKKIQQIVNEKIILKDNCGISRNSPNLP